MLSNINIKGFKSINEESINLKPYTIITGLNSSGKSTVIQAILLAVKHSNNANKYALDPITQYLEDYTSVRNKYINAKEISISLSKNEKVSDIKITSEGLESLGGIDLSFDVLGESKEPELLYLSANRQGPEELALISSTNKIGSSGQYILGYFNKLKDTPLMDEFCKYRESKTLSYQVSQWLSFITETKTELTTEPQSSSQVKVTFNDAKLGEVSPLNLGAGMSYVAKVIILCLIAKKGDVVVIENPEIHLHPKAQSLLSSLFVFVANNGVQIIVETHCEHLINKTRHQIYKKNIESDNVIIHYKKDVDSSFISLKLNSNGHYIEQNGNKTSFPSGFFDSTLNELIEIGG